MILKIERYKDGQIWWMYDNVRKASVTKSFKMDTVIPTRDFDVIVSDVDSKKCNCSTSDECSCHNITFRSISCSFKDDSEISIAFDTIAYLLNDNGKTIEKIVANYND